MVQTPELPSSRLKTWIGLVVSNALVIFVLPGAIWIGALLPAVLLRPWTDPIAALLVGIPQQRDIASSNPASLMMATALMTQASAIVMTYGVLWLSVRAGHPARFGPALALLRMGIQGWYLADRFPVPAVIPALAQRPALWAHAGMQFQALAALAAIPIVVVMCWGMFRAKKT